MRKNYWYQIIQYIPSTIRNESINVGVIMGDENGIIEKRILISQDTKMAAMLHDEGEKSSYDILADLYFGYYEIGDEKPIMSDRTQFLIYESSARTENPHKIFENLMDVYVL